MILLTNDISFLQIICKEKKKEKEKGKRKRKRKKKKEKEKKRKEGIKEWKQKPHAIIVTWSYLSIMTKFF